MRVMSTAAVALCWATIAAAAADKPDWAFPVMDKVQPPILDDGAPKHAPGSDRAYTRAQIEDLMNPPDWRPDMHPEMPKVVAHGGGGAVRACAACHLPTGTGHDESANIAGLPSDYLARQMADYKSGSRKGSGSMTAIAKEITDEDVREAAAYFARLTPRPWIRVVETDDVPRTYVGTGNKRLPQPDGSREPIGRRIIEIPEDVERVVNRDPGSGFVAFAPRGAVAAGGALARGDGGAAPCGTCHGPGLKGAAGAPALAGRQATYLVRQLFMFQSGERAGADAREMAPIAAHFSIDDMLALGAYVASLDPR